MDWFEPVRAYCERSGPGLWAEPLNAFSNLAFPVAAAAAARYARGDRAAECLCALVGIVGIGSFLFHTFANRWSMLADVLPIAIFIYAYFLLALRRLVGLGNAGSWSATAAFLLLGLGLVPALDAATGLDVAAATNGSIDYVPAILALLGVSAACLVRADPKRRRAGRGLAAMAGLFALSLTLRTVDRGACASLPFGTHFLWHILNAGLLYGLIRIATEARPARC